jgi:hypothetical protein
MAFTSATTRGGKTRGATSARTFLEAREPISKKAFAPLTHNWPWGIQALADFLVLQTVGSKQDDLCAYYIPIR